MTTIGPRLRGARQARGHTQEQAAREIGVTLNPVARWERGEQEPSTLARKGIERYIEEGGA